MKKDIERGKEGDILALGWEEWGWSQCNASKKDRSSIIEIFVLTNF
jgi:hypothetical protein